MQTLPMAGVRIEALTVGIEYALPRAVTAPANTHQSMRPAN
ncbi:hypothetical protein [Paraburkholderia phytofirmans]|nr:hypothetical protein [Paraburkholderia phytofirmans]